MSILLETPRLIITNPEAKDFDDLYALQSDADVMQYLGRGVRTHDEVKTGLEKAINHHNKYGFSLGSVFEKETHNFVGRAGLLHLGYDDTQPDIEIGYALLKPSWGKGYATELAQGCIDWGFQHLPVSKLVAVTRPENKGSRSVLEKANMKYVGPCFYWEIEVLLYEIHKKSL